MIVAGIPNTIDRDKRVPLKVRGFLHFIISNFPGDRKFNMDQFKKLVPDDLITLKACMELLIEYGYAKRVKVVDPKTRELRYYKVYIYEGHIDNVNIKTPEARAVSLFPDLIDPRPTIAKVRKNKRESTKVQTHHHEMMYDLCYNADTPKKAKLLSSNERGRVASALGRIRDAGGLIDDIYYFGNWWNKNWRSRDKYTGAYQPPRPEQVVEFWWTAARDKETGNTGSVPHAVGNTIAQSAGLQTAVDSDLLHKVMVERGYKNRKHRGNNAA